MRSGLIAAVTGVVLAAALNSCSDRTDTSSGLTTTAPRDGSRSGSVWVADEGGDSLTVLDAATDTVVTTLAGLTKLHNVQVGRDGATVYAVSSANLVVAIDATTYALAAAVPTSAAPAHVIEAPNGKV